MKKFFAYLLSFLPSARYEAASQKWGERSLIYSALQDARFDADAATRKEITRKARYWEANDAIIQRLTDLFEQFTVGAKGILMVPDSSMQEWNQAAAGWWAGWSEVCDLSTRSNFGILQGLIARSWFIDGECFVILTNSPDSKRPRIQVVESHRCETPSTEREREGKDIVDGIRIDPMTGRPVSYFIRDALDQTKYTEVKADFVLHVFEPSRPGQMRGLSFLYAVMNDLHDLSDLQIMEKEKAKDAAATSNIITTASGEIKSAAGLRRMKMNIGSQDATGNPVTKSDDQFYQTVLGSRTIVLKKGEDMKQFGNDSPSVATQFHWEYLTARVCAGVGISKLLVMPYSMQGTVTRADLDVSTIFFRSRSEVIISAIRRIYLWVMGWAVKYDPTLAEPPEDWAKVNARPPRAPNVDVGRNSAAVIAELEAGTRTFSDIYAEAGEDWREKLHQKAVERAYIRKLAQDLSTDGIELTPDEIAGMSLPADPPEPTTIPVKEPQHA